MREKKKPRLVVSEEAILDFSRLSTKDRLCWLDEARAFLSRTLPPQTKKIYEELRREW